MSGTISDYLEKKWLDHVLGTTSFNQPSHVYVALSTTDPLDDGSGITEPAVGAYTRSVGDDVFGTAASNRLKSNDTQIQFTQSTAGWGTLTHFGIYDAKTAGNFLGGGSLTTSKTVNSGDTVRIGVSQLSMEVLNGGMSTILANKLLDHTFKKTNYPFTSSAVYIALLTGSLSGSNTGTNLPEVTGNNYARIAADLWATASVGQSNNYGSLTFATASGAWGSIVSQAICDSSTNGTLLLYGALTTGSAITTDDEVTFASGSLSITVD